MCQISVIVPVYNVERYIEKCIRSILEQTFSDIEVIIVNDGSQDRSIDIIHNVFRDGRIKIINKKNAGLPQARKTGFENATGRYIVFVDADDWIDSNMLQLLYEKIVSSHADIVCCGVLFDDDNGNRIEEWNVEEETAYDKESAIINLHNSCGVYQFMWNKIFSRRVVSGSDFPMGHFVGEDYCTLIPMIEKAVNIIQIPENTYHYVQHGSNMTKAGFGSSFIQAYEHYNKLRKYLLKKYGTCESSILCYHLSEYIFIMNAMARNNTYQNDMVKEITKYVRKNITRYMLNKHIKKLYKCAAVVMAINWRIYTRMYKTLMRS